MGMRETMVPIEPPAQRAPAVIAHLQTCRRALAAAEREIPGLLLAVAEGRPGAGEDLAALREKIAAAQFSIEHHVKARQHAEQIDQEAIAAWKAAVQTLPPDEILAGLSKDACCRRCIKGTGCAITGADPLAGPCAHPVLVGALELHRYVGNPQIQRVYTAACVKLGLRKLQA
jgi:hypothetical protein